MWAIVLLGAGLPYGEIWLPLLVGMAVGGLCLVTIRLFQKPEAVALPLPPPVQKKSQDYDPFVQGSPSEQRKAHRRGGNPVEVFVAIGEETTPTGRGWVVDRSVGGLGLNVAEEMKVGTHLQLLPVSAAGVTPWTEVEVKSCRAIKDGFEVGCQFVRQPQWSVLLLFG
jgi:hypothetical protein